MRDPKEREPFKAVGEATRVANRCVLSGRPPAAVLRIWVAVQELLTSRSRLWDFTSHKQLADIAGISRRAVIEAIKVLGACGAIQWEPGAPGRLSKVRLAPALGIVNKSLHHRTKGPPKINSDGLVFDDDLSQWVEPSEQTSSLPIVNESAPHGEETGLDMVKRNLHTSEKGPSKSGGDDLVQTLCEAFDAEVVGEIGS